MEEIIKKMQEFSPQDEKEYESYIDVVTGFYTDHYKKILDGMLDLYSESLQNEENSREQDIYIKATISTLKHQKKWFELLQKEQNNREIKNEIL